MSSASELANGLDSMDNSSEQHQGASKKKRNLPGTPDPQAEVIALSPRTLMATNRFLCEVCGKGFQRDQNLQLHRRGHNLPWKLKQREDQGIRKRVYVCPETTCVHHDPSRALGDLTGIKKHFFRKHGDKKWKCEKCSKRYAVQSDWKAHQKVCGTREYRCDCGTLFSRRDSFITHRAFCDALAEEGAKLSAGKHAESQPSNGPGDGGGPSNGTIQTSSLYSQLTSHGAQGAEDPQGLEEGGVEALPSIRVQSRTAVTCSKSNSGPGLSLHLGTGPGPGPPGALQMPGSSSQTNGVMEASKGGRLLGNSDETMQWPASPGGAGMYSNMLTSDSEPLKGYDAAASGNCESWRGYGSTEQDNNTMAGMFVGSTSGSSAFGNSAMSQFAPPSVGGSIQSASYFGNSYIMPSKASSHHPRHSGSTQLPATALLQKAAMMGATVSNPSVFQNFRGDSSFLGSKEGRRTSMVGVSSSWPLSSSSSSITKPSTRPLSLDSSILSGGLYGGVESLYPALYSGQGSVQELLNSLCSGGAALFDSKLSSRRGPITGDESMRHHLIGQSSLVPHGSKSQDGFGSGPFEDDKHEGSRTTLDFLGIGDPSGAIAGSTMGMPRTLSQREIASITTSSAGIKWEPQVTQKKGGMQERADGGHFASM